MVRTIITPSNTSIQVSVPKDYVGKPVEVTCLALEELEEKHGQKTMADFFGVLPADAYKELKEQTQQARKEWNRGF